MKILKIRQNIFFVKKIDLIADFFRRGKVIVYPTDTIYGLGCLATNKKAINKIYKIKKREKKKPLLILVDSLAMAKRYCYVSKEQEKYLLRVWCLTPHPPFRRGAFRAVTVILKSRGVLPKELTGGADSLAVRLPKNDFLIKIIKAVKCPIVSTSVNIRGEKPLINVKNLGMYFRTPRTPLIRGAIKLPNLVVDAGKLKNKPSRIIDITDIENVKLLRK